MMCAGLVGGGYCDHRSSSPDPYGLGAGRTLMEFRVAEIHVRSKVVRGA